MKIAQVVNAIRVESSGPSYSVPGLCLGLAKAGCDVSLFFLDYPPAHLEKAPYKLVSCKRLGWGGQTFGISPAMLKGLSEACSQADIVHGNNLWKFPNVYPGWAVRGTKCKLVIAPRGTLADWSLKRSFLAKKIFGMLFQNAVLRRADMFHATSMKEFEEIRARGYRQPVAVVPIGMDIPKVESHAKENPLRIRKVVFFGRLHKVKGVDRLLLAWEEVARNGWELVIAGPDCGLLDALKGIVAERNLPRVSFVGEIKGHAKYDFLAGADIYVLPSDTENFGITAAEALASGTPVIASQGTPWEGLESEKCGRWVPIGIESLAAALKEMMALDDADRAQMGAHGKEWIRRDFAWEGIGVKMRTAYEWLLGRGDKPDWVIVD